MVGPLCPMCVRVPVYFVDTVFHCVRPPPRVEDLTPDLLTRLLNSGIKVILMTCLYSAVRHSRIRFALETLNFFAMSLRTAPIRQHLETLEME